ncbi:MAG TPA: ATP-binding protein [Gemmatimonadales bacterium]|nr:ATP-binding protein [Gemmatimonadales bacterium]
MSLQVVVDAPEAPVRTARFPSSSVRVRIPIGSETDVAVAGEQGRRLASRLDFSPTDVTVIATAIMEVARNVLQYARRGDLMLHLIQRRGRLGLAVVARDRGPGIPDITRALRDGTGLGLATVRRLMDEFRVRSEPGRGTTVTMRKWTRCRQVERAGARRTGHAGQREAR